MKYPSDHKANTRRRVLQEAAKAIWADGVEGIAIAPVMAAAGLTVGGFYAHFKSRDDLIAEAVSFMFEERYASFFARIDIPDPRDALGRFVDYYVSMRHRDATVGGCPIPTLAGQVPSLPSAARERFMLAVERLTDGVTGLLEAMGTGEAPAVAASAMAEMIGAVSLSRLTRDAVKAEGLLEDARRSVRRKLGLDSTDAEALARTQENRAN